MQSHEDNKRMIREFVCAVNGVCEHNIVYWFSRGPATLDIRPEIPADEVRCCLKELSELPNHSIGFTDGRYWHPAHKCASGQGRS